MIERKDEAFFRKSLERWLSVEYPDLAQEWRYEPNGQSTPDYQLTLGDRKYAIEVTRIAERSAVTALFSFKDLCREVEDEAGAAGVLSGCHILSFYSPVAMSTALRNSIREKAMQYMTAHRDDEAADVLVIVADDRDRMQRRVAIQKLGTGKDALICQPGAVCRIVDEVDTEIAPLVQAAVARKQRRFDEVGELSPRILLLGHDYPIPDLAVYEKCLSQLQAGGLLRDFAAVFLAITDAHGEMLYEAAGCFPSRQQQ